jgi:threonine dehydrogenase-like Zn-dependent dehydrogenase
LLAVAPGCRVTVAARYPHQAAAARRFGAAHVIDGADYDAVARLTGAAHFSAPLNTGMLLGGFDLVYDCVGSSRTVGDSLRWCRAGGAVVLVGVDLALHRVDLSPVWYQEVDLIGTLSHGMDEWQGQRRHTYHWVIDWLRAGPLTVDGLITHRFGFDQHRRAVAVALDKKHGRGPIRVVFTYS